jgi:hypothetical protein
MLQTIRSAPLGDGNAIVPPTKGDVKFDRIYHRINGRLQVSMFHAFPFVAMTLRSRNGRSRERFGIS